MRVAFGEDSAARRTVLSLVATGLAAVPLKGLLTDSGWLIDVWLSMVIVIAPAIVLRLRRAPGALDIWPGIVLLIPWLTARFVPQHAFAGLLPTHRTLSDVARLMDSLHTTTRDGVAPIHSTAAVRLVLCALLGLLAALIDLIAVVGRRGALAGVPLLLVYTVSGAVPRRPVAWPWFALAAFGYLILLALDNGDELHRWGRRITRRDGRDRLVGPVSAQRVGVMAVVLALAVPLLVPVQAHNLISDAFHHSKGDGSGGGSGVGGSVSPFAELRGQLNRGTPAAVMTVRVQGPRTAVPPFYVRTNVLDEFTGSGWRVSNHGDTQPIGSSDFGTDPPVTAPSAIGYQLAITISGLNGNAPVFAVPTAISGLGNATTWSSRDQLLLGSNVHRGDTFAESVAQPAPTRAELEQSENFVPADVRRSLALPSVPRTVGDLVAEITKDRHGPYDKARAISDYFADPTNGFEYSLQTKAGDSGSDLVDFLRNKTGYCQQYAAAMGVMLRKAGIPARVVLGYMHPVADAGGRFIVSTYDAHAWVEAYFSGIGWIPFDPTPVAGLDGGSKADLGYAPHVYPNGNNDIVHARATNIQSAKASSSRAALKSAGTGSARVHAATSTTPRWLGGIIVLMLVAALAPAGTRTVRRRRRYSAARTGDPDALWAELTDSAVDLGYVWSPARSPRQVAAWLGRDTAEPGALVALAAAVERTRYSAGSADPSEHPDMLALTRDLTRARAALRSHRSGRARVRARVWPASLGLGGRLRSTARRH